MLNLKFIQDNPDLVIEKLAVKRFDARAIVEKVIALYKRRNEVQNDSEIQKAEMNKISKEIGQLIKEGKQSEVELAKQKTVELKEQIRIFEEQFALIDAELAQLQVQLPNLPSALVPKGKGAEDNEVVATGGIMPNLPTGAKPHWELAAQYDLIDFELGVKITGAGFPVYKGFGARIQRALINFFHNSPGKNKLVILCSNPTPYNIVYQPKAHWDKKFVTAPQALPCTPCMLIKVSPNNHSVECRLTKYLDCC